MGHVDRLVLFEWRVSHFESLNRTSDELVAQRCFSVILFSNSSQVVAL